MEMGLWVSVQPKKSMMRVGWKPWSYSQVLVWPEALVELPPFDVLK
jgi:hypothetical protein